ncbi:lipopolysaccharide assembly LapA domain-containing protein [uncultured Jatrophihabitans sp.]|uniref:LapA family protein n=1 Tax=uncultured Jatrophihabitans sp. TaxID=1610747 RepID=UPI0035CAD114
MTDFEKPRTPGEQPDPAYPAAAADEPVAGTDDRSYGTASAADQSATAAPADDRPAPAGFDDRGRVRRGRISTLWITLIAAAIVLILLIIFIAQNLQKASIHFLGLNGHMPTGLVILIAAIVGLLIAAIPGTIRILQLRKSLKHNTPKAERTAGRP